MATNYFGTLHVIKAVTPGMIDRGSGHIVNICSLGGFLGVFGYSAYCASKYAVRGLSDVLRAELRPYGIHFSVVYPPDTDTPQLAYENPFKPPETRALGSGKALSAAEVARTISGRCRSQPLHHHTRASKRVCFTGWSACSATCSIPSWISSSPRTRQMKG